MDIPTNPVPYTEASMIDFDEGPSSPFVSQLDAHSRVASKQFDAPAVNTSPEQHTMDIFATPPVSRHITIDDMAEDKENMPQMVSSAPKLLSSPRQPSTAEHRETAPEPAIPEPRPTSADSELMPPPPPSMRKAHPTPNRSPLKALKNGAATTPRPLSRGNSYTRSDAAPPPSTAASNFQAGLDMRASQMQTQDAATVDDTCFSTFSEIPDMTLFAKLGQSPAKRGETTRTPGRHTDATPRTSRKRSSPSRSPSPTPRRLKTPATAHDGNTTFLIDFTQQLEGAGSYRPSSPSKSSTQPNLLDYMHSQRSPHKTTRQSYATPSKPNSLLNLLDFELPPAPTPRSIPTITVRELESLKSSYLSQISSLKATLSGREAEVESLKRAVGDAERRVGEALESLRDEKSRREHVEQEKAEWEKRGHEVENVLKSVKEEVMRSEAEKEDLLQKMEDCDRRTENAEARAVKAEERFADALAARGSSGEGNSNDVEEQVQKLVAAQIDSKIEAVSRELHAVYKEKHERKVATLKKSYEARGEKKCAELQTRVMELERHNEELQFAKDNTFSGPLPESTAVEAELKAQLEEHKAHRARLENEMQTSQQQQDQLMRELEQERIEKGDLVAAVDEMLTLQSESGPSQAVMSVVEDFRKSISRPSGLRAPAGMTASTERKIGRGGLSRMAPGKSRMLANIERMGRTASGNGSATE